MSCVYQSLTVLSLLVFFSMPVHADQSMVKDSVPQSKTFDDRPWRCASGSIMPWPKDIVANLEAVPETFPKGTSENKLLAALKQYGYIGSTNETASDNAACRHSGGVSYWKRTGLCTAEQRTLLWCSDANGILTDIKTVSQGPIIASPIAPAESGPLNVPPISNGPDTTSAVPPRKSN